MLFLRLLEITVKREFALYTNFATPRRWKEEEGRMKDEGGRMKEMSATKGPERHEICGRSPKGNHGGIASTVSVVCA